MINLTTARRLDKLGICIDSKNFHKVYGHKEEDGIDYYPIDLYPSPTIEELLELLPKTYNNECLTISITEDICVAGFLYNEIRECHKRLEECLARLLIKLTEEGI